MPSGLWLDGLVAQPIPAHEAIEHTAINSSHLGDARNVPVVLFQERPDVLTIRNGQVLSARHWKNFSATALQALSPFAASTVVTQNRHVPTVSPVMVAVVKLVSITLSNAFPRPYFTRYLSGFCAALIALPSVFCVGAVQLSTTGAGGVEGIGGTVGVGGGVGVGVGVGTGTTTVVGAMRYFPPCTM
jgi:hypothetical protein